MMEYRILGPLEVLGDDGPLGLGGAKQRALLALLLVHSGRVVSPERLIDELWGDAPPETARETVHVYVSRLRKALPAGALVTEGAGYALRVEPDAVDLARFERLRAEGRFHEALALWRGPPLAEFDEDFARVEGGRLDELRLSTLEERLDADLARGRHTELVGELEALVDAHPHRERLRGQLMLALYRSGRQAEALAAYRDARLALHELGIEPSEQLRRLERQILTQDAALMPRRSHADSALVRLPVPATSFVGRERELTAIAGILAGASASVVTLTGAAGAGKSRLAVEIASRMAHAFPDGVFFVPLEDVRDPALVVPAIANALGVDAVADAAEAVAGRLADRRVLVVLDNFEQVLDAAPAVARLVTPASVFIVTSRAPMNIAAERQYPVPALAQSEARALFVERARAVRPDFDMSRAVGEICRRLDGLPLAIELAAARVRLMTPEVMLPRLGDRLSLLTRGPSERPTRQQTLRAALDWSYDLLPDDARGLFARLSVFAGGFDLSAVESICDGDLESFRALVDNGLIDVRGERFALLESIHEYSSERLAVDPTAAQSFRLRHAEYYASLGERLLEADRGDGHQVASQRLADEVGNFEAAYAVLREARRRADELRVVEALAGALGRVGRTRDALGILEDALREETLAPAARASIEAQAAWLAADVGELARARTLASVALEHARSAGDVWGEITALAAIWLSAIEEGDLMSADDALHEAESVARLRLPQRVASVLNDRSVIALERGEYARARELLDEALERASGTPFGPWINVALSHLLENDFAAAEPWLRKAMTRAYEAGAMGWLFYALHGFVVFHSHEDPERAALLSGALDSLRRSVGIQLQQLELRLATQTRDDLASRLGGRFYELETAGAEMELDDVVALALAA
ncbi:MAG: BTAD domain-containing putative transcriptional regulator [Gaiellaceae bacterium]|jgi:predicted ATPase/DNA-binding SARP family transcriptional activator